MLTQEDAKRIFSDVQTEHQFWLKDIGPIKNLKELANSLKSMKDDVFKHHVNNERNDFSNWIREVIEDKELANDVSKISQRKKMAKAIDKRISKLEKIKREDERKKEKVKKKESKKEAKIKPERIEVKKEEPKVEKIPEELPEVGIKVKINEILQREKEIAAKEEVIQRAEERIEKVLASPVKEKKFFSKEFTQGLIIGILLSAIIWLIYNSFLKGII